MAERQQPLWVTKKPLPHSITEDTATKRSDKPGAAPGQADTAPGDPRPKEHWRHRFVPSVLRRDRLAGQMVRFSMVGALNTGVDWGLFFLFNVLFNSVARDPLVTHRHLYLTANAIAFSAGILNSFLWNKHWTFSAGRSQQTRREALVFLAVSIISLGINTGGLWVLSHLLTGTTLVTVAFHKLGTTVVTMTWNFLGYRFLAFRTTAPGGRAPREGG